MYIENLTESNKYIAFSESLFKAWSIETCSPSLRNKWSEENKSLGQCFVSAVIASEVFGGEVLELHFDDGSIHYYNKIDNSIVDFTSDQFKCKLDSSFYKSGIKTDIKDKMDDIKRNRLDILRKRLELR